MIIRRLLSPLLLILAATCSRAQPSNCEQALPYLQQGRELQHARNFKAAAAQFAQAARLCPENVSASMGLTESLIAANELKAAQASARAFVKSNPGLSLAHILLGTTLYLQHRFPAAAGEFKAVTVHDPSNSLAFRLLGMTLYFLHNYEQGVPALKQALRLDPKDGEALYFLAGTEIAEGKYQAAETSARRLLALNPHSYQAYDQLGVCQQKMGQSQAALHAFRMSQQYAPPGAADAFHAYSDMASLLLDLHRPKEALAPARQASRLARKASQPPYLLAKALVMLQRDAEAVSPLKRAIARDPQSAQAHSLLGQVYHRLGQEQLARQEFATSKKLFAKALQNSSADRTHTRSIAQPGISAKPSLSPPK